MKFIFYIILFIFYSSFSWSQTLFPILGGQRAGTSVFTFLNIGVSARATGMGESVVALNQDATSIHYNPAIIAQLGKTELSIAQIQWPAEISYDYFSITRHLQGRHYIGLNATKAVNSHRFGFSSYFNLLKF